MFALTLQRRVFGPRFGLAVATRRYKSRQQSPRRNTPRGVPLSTKAAASAASAEDAVAQLRDDAMPFRVNGLAERGQAMAKVPDQLIKQWTTVPPQQRRAFVEQYTSVREEFFATLSPQQRIESERVLGKLRRFERDLASRCSSLRRASGPRRNATDEATICYLHDSCAMLRRKLHAASSEWEVEMVNEAQRRLTDVGDEQRPKDKATTNKQIVATYSELLAVQQMAQRMLQFELRPLLESNFGRNVSSSRAESISVEIGEMTKEALPPPLKVGKNSAEVAVNDGAHPSPLHSIPMQEKVMAENLESEEIKADEQRLTEKRDDWVSLGVDVATFDSNNNNNDVAATAAVKMASIRDCVENVSDSIEKPIGVDGNESCLENPANIPAAVGQQTENSDSAAECIGHSESINAQQRDQSEESIRTECSSEIPVKSDDDEAATVAVVDDPIILASGENECSHQEERTLEFHDLSTDNASSRSVDEVDEEKTSQVDTETSPSLRERADDVSPTFEPPFIFTANRNPVHVERPSIWTRLSLSDKLNSAGKSAPSISESSNRKSDDSSSESESIFIFERQKLPSVSPKNVEGKYSMWYDEGKNEKQQQPQPQQVNPTETLPPSELWFMRIVGQPFDLNRCLMPRDLAKTPKPHPHTSSPTDFAKRAELEVQSGFSSLPLGPQREDSEKREKADLALLFGGNGEESSTINMKIQPRHISPPSTKQICFVPNYFPPHAARLRERLLDAREYHVDNLDPPKPSLADRTKVFVLDAMMKIRQLSQRPLPW